MPRIPHGFAVMYWLDDEKRMVARVFPTEVAAVLYADSMSASLHPQVVALFIRSTN